MKTSVYDITVTDQTWWEQTFQFFEDEAREKPLDLTGKTVTIQFTAGPELTEGSGLEVDAKNGKVTPGVLISTQFDGQWRLNILTEEHPQTPVWGQFRVRTLSQA